MDNIMNLFQKICELCTTDIHRTSLKGWRNINIRGLNIFERLRHVMLSYCNVAQAFQTFGDCFQNLKYLSIDVDKLVDDIPFKFRSLTHLYLTFLKFDADTQGRLMQFLSYNNSTLIGAFIKKIRIVIDSELQYVYDGFIQDICFHLQGTVEITCFITQLDVSMMIVAN